MRDNIENTARGTGTTWGTRRPKTLDELFEREEELAKDGALRQAELLGGDARDLLNLPYHFRRKPLGTSAIVAAAAVFLVTRFKGSKEKKKQGAHRPAGILDFAQGLIGSTLASAFIGGKGALPNLKRYAGRKLWGP